jgi:hypothetical protein
MTEWAWATVPLGLGLIALGWLDMLHVQVESPISNRLNRLGWRLLLAISRPLPRQRRDYARSWGLPLLILLDVGFWILLAVGGFGLLYVPLLHDPAYFLLAGAATPWPLADALNFSATSFFTLGFGDIVPRHPLTRLLAVLEGAAGLLSLSLAVTYLLSVYPLIARKTALASALNQETGGRADGVLAVQRYLVTGHFEALAERLRSVNDELVVLGEAHALYPVLFYVRPRLVHESFIRALAVTQGLVGTLRYVMDVHAHPEIGGDPRLVMLEEGLLSTLHGLERSSHLAAHLPSPVTEVGEADLHQLFTSLADELRQAGVRPWTADASARAGFVRFRQATDPYIRAYAATVDYELGEVWAIYDRRARDASLDPAPAS